MAIPIASLAVTPYMIGAPQVIPDVAPTRGEHKIYTPAPPAAPNTAPAIDDRWTPDGANPSVQVFAGTANGGSAYYLLYNNNQITSLRLPSPPPAGIDFFLTANMSGCKFFVDTITGSADLIVYHANARSTAPAPPHSAVNFQDPAALAELDRLHTAAQADYAAGPYNLALVNVASLAKAVYYGGGALAAEQRKAGPHRGPGITVPVPVVGPVVVRAPAMTPGRTLNVPDPNGAAGATMNVAPEFWGGCSVFGFYNAGWHFYYQTWGAVEYNRPSGVRAVARALFTGHWNYLSKLVREGSHHEVNMRYSKVVDHAQIY